jgi:hypothetical protein
MRTISVVAVLLASALTASAQESLTPPPNLFDEKTKGLEEKLPVELTVDGDAQQDKDKKDQPEVRTISGGALKDELPVGPYNRPMWTLHRVSPQTRIYLQVDPGEVEFEQWLDMRFTKDRGKQQQDQIRLSEEFEFGLGARFQLDLYYNTLWVRNQGQNATLTERGWAAEVRYALADWGVIPGNPTLYLEYILWNNNPNDGIPGDEASASIEPKLLLGGEIATGWHWGTNFYYERTFNASVREMGVTGSVLHTVVDGIFTAGLTVKLQYESDNVNSDQSKTERSREAYIGPAFQVRMAPVEQEMEVNGVKTKITRRKAHLDFEPIFGLTGESSRVQALLVFGWDF